MFEKKLLLDQGPKRDESMVDEEDLAELQDSIAHVRDLAKEFFSALVTSPKLGIVFADATCGNSGQNLNHLMLNLLKVGGKCCHYYSRASLALLTHGALLFISRNFD